MRTLDLSPEKAQLARQAFARIMAEHPDAYPNLRRFIARHEQRRRPNTRGGALWRWCLSLFAWRYVRTAGVFSYYENSVSGARRAVRITRHGYSPLDRQWLDRR